jgi:hypothetical protein
LRKTLIAALAALTALAMAAVALAQNPAPVVNATAKASPTKAGTKKKPKSETVSLHITNSEESKSSASRIEIAFPATLKLATKGLKTCNADVLAANGPSACPSKSKAGGGNAIANLNPDQPSKLFFKVTTVVIGKNKLSFFLQQTDTENGAINPNGVAQSLPASIKKKGSGQKITIDIPENLQQPAPGVFSALLEINSKLGLKNGKKALVSSVGCKSKKHKIGVTISYVPNPNPPAKSKVSASAPAKCSK